MKVRGYEWCQDIYPIREMKLPNWDYIYGVSVLPPISIALSF